MSLGPPVTSDADETSQVLCIHIKEEFITDEEYGLMVSSQDDCVERRDLRSEAEAERLRADLRHEAETEFAELQASGEIQTVVIKSEEEEEECRDDNSPWRSKKLSEKELCSLIIK